MKFFDRPPSAGGPLRWWTASLVDRFAGGRLGKKAAIGEGVIMIYRLVVVSFIALIVLGVSSVFYGHYVDVRDVEARILARDVVDCLAPAGVLDLGKISDENRKSLLSYCGFDSDDRFYVGVDVVDAGGGEFAKMSHGDSGVLWIRELFEGVARTDRIKKYRPGYYNGEYPVFVGDDKMKMQLEVLVNG